MYTVHVHCSHCRLPVGGEKLRSSLIIIIIILPCDGL